MPAGAYIHIFTYALAYETTKCNKQEMNVAKTRKYFSRQATADISLCGVLIVSFVLDFIGRQRR